MAARNVIFLLCLLFISQPVLAEERKSIIGKLGDTVVDTVDSVGGTVGDTVNSVVDPKEAHEIRKEIDAEAREGIAALLKSSKAARALYEVSYGYAVFDTRKFSFLITTGTGAGVAVEKPSEKRTYMKMITGGANLGAGVQYYKVVFLFENKKSFRKFVDYGWEANSEASASFGKEELGAGIRFVEGVAIYQINDTGIMANLNITGTKYYKAGKLNS